MSNEELLNPNPVPTSDVTTTSVDSVSVPETKKTSTMSHGMKVGLAVTGIIAALATATGITWFVIRKHKKNKAANEAEEESK